MIKQLLYLKTSIGQNFKDQHIKLHPPFDNSPSARFYVLANIFKVNIPLRPIVSACVTSSYKVANYLTKMLLLYCCNNFSFVRDSKGLAKSLKGQKVAVNETLVSFDVSVLFTNISVPVAIEVINNNFTEYVNEKRNLTFPVKCLLHTQRQSYLSFGISTQQLCLLLPGKFYQQFQRCCSGFPLSSVIANI